MKIDKLKEIFKNFYCNNDRAILIDGVWGVGKTHTNPAIEDFFKKSNYFINDLIGKISISQWHLANTMVLYSSKFGFQDELKKHIKALKSTDKSSAIRYETLLKSL